MDPGIAGRAAPAGSGVRSPGPAGALLSSGAMSEGEPDPAAADEQRFVELYRQAAPALHVWASVRIRPSMRAFCEVEDLLQEVWCRAFAIRERFDRESGAFRPWLFRVAKNVLLEVARSARQAERMGAAAGRTSRLLQLDGVADEVTSITRQVARSDALRGFHRRIEELPDDDRELVLHIGLEGLSYAEVATRLDLNHETVKKRWQRLRSRLEARGLSDLLLEP